MRNWPITTSIFNVRDYGAAGNGIADDTQAILAAIDAIPSRGGVLYFPAGTYKTSGGFTLSKPMLVAGEGNSSAFGTADFSFTAPTQITCTSATASLFTVTANGVSFRDMVLTNTAGSTPSDGAGITISAGGDQAHYDNLTISGFYINIDNQIGFLWHMDGCYILNPVLYGIKQRNTMLGDLGDFTISNTQFHAGPNLPDAAIRYESGGGMKVSNCTFDAWTERTGGSLTGENRRWDCAIDLRPGFNSSNFQVTNCAFENWLNDAIRLTGNGTNSWTNIIINGNQFGGYNASGHAIEITDANANIFNRVIITNNVLLTTTASVAAISLSKVSNVRLANNINSGFPTYISITSCSDLEDNFPVVARYATSAGASIANNSDTTLNFGTKVFDSMSAVTQGASWNFTAPIPGVYSVAAHVLIDGTSAWAPTEEGALSLFKNGALYSNLFDQMQYPSTSQTIYMKLGGADLVQLDKGDSIFIKLYQNSGGTRNLHNDVVFNYVSIAKL